MGCSLGGSSAVQIVVCILFVQLHNKCAGFDHRGTLQCTALRFPHWVLNIFIHGHLLFWQLSARKFAASVFPQPSRVATVVSLLFIYRFRVSVRHCSVDFSQPNHRIWIERIHELLRSSDRKGPAPRPTEIGFPCLKDRKANNPRCGTTRVTSSAAMGTTAIVRLP